MPQHDEPATPRAGADLSISAHGLGRTEITIGATRITPSKDVLFALLLLVVVRYPRSWSYSELLDLLWPNVDERCRRHALRQLVYRLRRFGCRLSTQAEALRLDTASVSLDIERTRAPQWTSSASFTEVSDALCIFPEYSPTFSQPFSEWLHAWRRDICARSRDACLSRIALFKSQGRWVELEEWSTLCLQADHFNEEASLARAEALAMRGSKLEAQAVLTQFLQDLGEEQRSLGLPARVLRRRISDLNDSHAEGRLETPIGREREFAILVAAARSAKERDCTAVFLQGAAGTGKSLLLDHFERFCNTQGFSILRVNINRELHSTPFSTLVEAISQGLDLPGALACSPTSLGHLRSLAAAPSARESMPLSSSLGPSSTMAQAIQSLFYELETERPLLLILDNYLEGDAESGIVMGHLVARMRGRRLLVIVSARTRPANAPIVSSAQAVRDVRLQDLSRDDTRRLLESTLRPGVRETSEALLDAIYKTTGGHPLFVREAALTSLDQVSPSLEGAIWSRAYSLSMPAQRALAILSLALTDEDSTGDPELEYLRDSDIDSVLHELVSAGMLPSRGSGSLRPYSVVAATIRNGLPAAYVTSIHFHIGCTLEQRALSHGSADDAWRGARHLALAREGDRAARLLCAAADQQLTTGHPATSAALLDGAARCALRESTALLCQLRELVSRRLIGDWERAASLCVILSTHRSRGLLEVGSLLDVHLTSLEAELHCGGAPISTMARSASAMREVTYPPERRERAASLTAILASNLADRSTLAAAARTVDDVAPPPKGSFDGRMVRIIAEHDFGDLDLAQARARDLVALVRIDGSAEETVRALLAASVPERSMGHYQAALDLLYEAHSRSEASQLWSLATRCADTISGVLFDCGHFAGAQRWQLVAETTCRSMSAHWTSRTVVHQQLRIAAHVSTATPLDPDFVDSYAVTVLADRLAVRREHDLAALTMHAIRHDDTTRLSRIVPELLAGLEICRGQRRLDYILAATIAGLRRLDLRSFSADEARQFCTAYRSSPADPQWHLLAAISNDRGSLFPN